MACKQLMRVKKSMDYLSTLFTLHKEKKSWSPPSNDVFLMTFNNARVMAQQEEARANGRL
jgi:hypothetical protein